MSQFLEGDPLMHGIVGALFGLLVGSFLNVVIYRLPLMLEHRWRKDCRSFLGLDEEPPDTVTFNLMWPGSFCPQCRTPVKPWQNVPVFSYLLLRGRCGSCRAEIAIRYPLVEVLTAATSCIVAVRFGLSIEGILALSLTWALIALSVIDLDHYLLPDSMTIPGVWLGLVASLGGWFTDPASSIVGAAAGYLVLWCVFHVFKFATGKEGMGFGDFKLLAMLGAWLGWQALPAIVLLASTVGALVGLALILLAGRDRARPIPFGPYLATAGWICLLWGDRINLEYLRWVGAIV